MKKVAVFSALLVAGLALSQFLPGLLGGAHAPVQEAITALTMIALAFIMIHVGQEFEIRKDRLREYGWDYVVAMTAAAFPWVLVTGYFVFVLLPSTQWGSWDVWKESLLAGRFAAPTSAGVLFAMLAAAGLSATWLFHKARVLAIFDDLDTVLLMIPLKMMMVGLAWQLGVVVVLMFGLLWLAWRYLHRLAIPSSWRWVLGYSAVIVAISEVVYHTSKLLDDTVPIHIEVLLPAFVLGCMIRRPEAEAVGAEDPHHGSSAEKRAALVVSSTFMLLVGLSLPSVVALSEAGASAADAGAAPIPGWGTIALHVIAVSVLANLGKMFPLFCYRNEAHWKERLAVCIGMWPRGEVGAGVLIISLGYGIGGPMLLIAMLSLALNLVLTGVFILWVKKLLASVERTEAPAGPSPTSRPAVVAAAGRGSR